MQTVQADCFTAYHNVKLTRDDSGVLTVLLHTNGGPCLMTAHAHTEFVEAFYLISQDRANKIVILTGAGGDFITNVDWSSFGDAADPGVWSQIHDEGVQALENIANIRVPVPRERPSRMWLIMRLALHPVTESLLHGAIAREQDELKPSYSTHSHCRRALQRNGESLQKLCPTAMLSGVRRNWPRYT